MHQYVAPKFDEFQALIGLLLRLSIPFPQTPQKII